MSGTELLFYYKDVINLAISAANLIVIVFFFISTRNYDLDFKKYEKKTVQFRELLLRQNIPKIEEFFLEIENKSIRYSDYLNRSFKSEEEFTKVMYQSVRFVSDKCIKFRKLFADQVFAFDETLGLKIYNDIDLLMDEMSQFYDGISYENENEIDTDAITNLVRQNRIKLLKTLHEYEPIDLTFTGRVKYNDPTVLLVIIFTIMLIVINFF